MHVWLALPRGICAQRPPLTPSCLSRRRASCTVVRRTGLSAPTQSAASTSTAFSHGRALHSTTGASSAPPHTACTTPGEHSARTCRCIGARGSLLRVRSVCFSYDVLSYYNVPVNATRSSRDNPLRVLTRVTTPSDFVVLKIVRRPHTQRAAAVQRARWPTVPRTGSPRGDASSSSRGDASSSSHPALPPQIGHRLPGDRAGAPRRDPRRACGARTHRRALLRGPRAPASVDARWRAMGALQQRPDAAPPTERQL